MRLWLALLLVLCGCSAGSRLDERSVPAPAKAVMLQVGQWQIHGDFLPAPGAGRRPAALLLNKAAGDRRAYEGLARELARRGISSLRLDLRGHGESINAGRFVPGAPAVPDVLEGTEADIIAAVRFLKEQPRVDATRIAIVGASYSGEAMAAAARQSGRYARAYVALSPGSFSAESAAGIDRSGAEWLLTRSARERSPAVRAAVAGAEVASMRVQVWVLDASSHATDVLAEVPGLPARIADWIAGTLGSGRGVVGADSAAIPQPAQRG